ncbi:MAG: pseudaminic acid biosynthesis-associated methylase [Nitrososphaeraceae archaeon]
MQDLFISYKNNDMLNNLSENNEQQRNFWSGAFGNSYIGRNTSIKTSNQYHKEQTGITIDEIFEKYFSTINRNSEILELGCNIGLKLSILQRMGFKNLYGLELNKKAIDIARKNYPEITFFNSSIEDYKSKGKQYDLVYTSCVLIHINPTALNSIINKIINLTKEYIFGYEYYSDSLVEVVYRNHQSVMWKQNFPLLFTQNDSSIKILKQDIFKYKDENLADIAYLLKKNS